MELIGIKKLIEQNDKIVLYRHIHPDFDAYGSQLGLKHLIMDNYPTKTVLTYGLEKINSDYVEEMDNPQDIHDFLSIIMDTSTLKRADDDSFLKAKTVAKIDHHLKSEVMCENEYVDTNSCSTAQIVARLAVEAGWKIGKEAASYLYLGIMSDSVRFSIDKVNSETFTLLAKLSECGIDIPWLNRVVYDESIEEYRGASYFRNNIVFDEDIAYLYINEEDYRATGLDEKKCKDYVDLMGNIAGVDKYVVFAYKEDGTYNISLRSHKPPVVHICQKYGGGGHALACGAPSVTFEETKDIIQMLKEAK